MAYRIRVESMEATGNGDVHLDCWIETGSNGEYTPIANGHRTMVLSGDAVLAITNGPGTVAQKRTALLALFKQTASDWGVTKSDSALVAMQALVPSLPIMVAM
jgi:hypothetical protein